MYQVAWGDYARFWKDLSLVLVGGLEGLGRFWGVDRFYADCGYGVWRRRRGKNGRMQVRSLRSELQTEKQEQRQRPIRGSFPLQCQDDGEKQATAKATDKDNGDGGWAGAVARLNTR